MYFVCLGSIEEFELEFCIAEPTILLYSFLFLVVLYPKIRAASNRETFFNRQIRSTKGKLESYFRVRYEILLILCGRALRI